MDCCVTVWCWISSLFPAWKNNVPAQFVQDHTGSLWLHITLHCIVQISSNPYNTSHPVSFFHLLPPTFIWYRWYHQWRNLGLVNHETHMYTNNTSTSLFPLVTHKCVWILSKSVCLFFAHLPDVSTDTRPQYNPVGCVFTTARPVLSGESQCYCTDFTTCVWRAWVTPRGKSKEFKICSLPICFRWR